jgi:hypothetical protein
MKKVPKALKKSELDEWAGEDGGRLIYALNAEC